MTPMSHFNFQLGCVTDKGLLKISLLAFNVQMWPRHSEVTLRIASLFGLSQVHTGAYSHAK